MKSLRQATLALTLATALLAGPIGARAHSELSEASALSALPVAVSVAAPAGPRQVRAALFALCFAHRDVPPGGAPVWRMAHTLNHCGSAEAALYRQGLGDFFLDRPHRYEAAFVVLSTEAQAKLLPLLRELPATVPPKPELRTTT